MRRRLLTATVSAVLVAVLLLGLPLAFIGARFVEDIELRELTARSEALGRQIDSRTEAGEEVPQSTVDNAATGTGRLDAYITVLTSDGQVLYAGEELSGDTVTRTLTTDDGSLVTLSVPSYQITLREAQIVFLVAVATVVAFGPGSPSPSGSPTASRHRSSTSRPRQNSWAPGRSVLGSRTPVSRRSTSSRTSSRGPPTGWRHDWPPSGSSPRTPRTSSGRR